MTRTEAATRACVLPYLKLGFSAANETVGVVAKLHMDTANIKGILSNRRTRLAIHLHGRYFRLIFYLMVV